MVTDKRYIHPETKWCADPAGSITYNSIVTNRYVLYDENGEYLYTEELVDFKIKRVTEQTLISMGFILEK